MHLGSISRGNAYFGMGNGPILLSHLYCTGSESSLLDCSRDMYGSLGCSHHEDAGVTCQGIIGFISTLKLHSSVVIVYTCTYV